MFISIEKLVIINRFHLLKNSTNILHNFYANAHGTHICIYGHNYIKKVAKTTQHKDESLTRKARMNWGKNTHSQSEEGTFRKSKSSGSASNTT